MKTPRTTKENAQIHRKLNDAQKYRHMYALAQELERELIVTEQLLGERQKLLDAVPECPAHGKCVPHALEWIEKSKNKLI